MTLLLLIAAQALPRAATPLEGLCERIDNTYSCAQAVEAAQIPHSAGRVRRVGRVLQIRLSSGSWIHIANDSLYDYSYLGYVRRPAYFVLHAQGGEWTVVKVVNARTGWTAIVDEIPVPSPDGHRLLTASLALEAAFSPNRVAVWRVTGDTLALEWSEEPKDWGPARPRWLSSTSFQLMRMRVLQEPPYSILPTDTVIGHRVVGAGWHLRSRR